MGYTKVISYSNLIEVYEYEGNIRHNGRKRGDSTSSIDSKDIRVRRDDVPQQEKQTKVRTKENARRSVLAFKRLVSANLSESDKPVFLTLTYAENLTDLKLARKDFNSFTTNVQYRFGKQIRFVCVPEFQKRVAVHFHTLFWGLAIEVVRNERDTRFLANMWGKGFVDLKETDGHKKIAGYCAKYMQKSFLDERLAGMRAWTCSRNMKKPFIDKNTLILPYYYGYHGIDLSTAQVLHESEYLTQWLGKGRYRLFAT